MYLKTFVLLIALHQNDHLPAFNLDRRLWIHIHLSSSDISLSCKS